MKLTEKELNEFPIGTMLIYDNGYLIKTDCKERQKNWYKIGNDSDNGWYGSDYITKTKFHKVKIPTTWGEYIPPKPILDEKEKAFDGKKLIHDSIRNNIDDIINCLLEDKKDMSDDIEEYLNNYYRLKITVEYLDNFKYSIKWKYFYSDCACVLYTYNSKETFDKNMMDLCLEINASIINYHRK